MVQNMSTFCGVAHFSVWDAHLSFLSPCMVSLTVSLPAHMLLLVLSVVHILINHSKRYMGRSPQSPTIAVRSIVCITLTLLPVISIFLFLFDEKVTLSASQWLDITVQSISWAIHTVFVILSQKYFRLSLRGPLSLVIAVVMTLGAMAVHLYFVIKHLVGDEKTADVVDEFVTYIEVFMLLGYLATLLPSKRPLPIIQDDPARIGINAEDEPLLFSQNTSDEGAVLGKAERGSVISCATFWWVNSLMLKGSKLQLRYADDLFDLPDHMSTRKIDENFQETLHRMRHLETSNNALLTHPSKFSLLTGLNRTFGWSYYSLGILKFFGDCLAFSGPILLNLLVTYMTSTSEPEWHGYLYVGCLFLSTFLNALISTHFNYLISVVGLKVRAAIITAVYRKALKVNSVELSVFSTGEVVNFMSTDTDRIVNFCPSFHQFWSLPVQIVVALYLLYKEVQLAFLAGLGFALLLIPVNR